MCISTSLQTQGIAPGTVPSDLTPGHDAVPRLHSHSGLAHGPGYLAYNGVFPISPFKSRASVTYMHCLYSSCRYRSGACSPPCLHGHCLLFGEQLHGPIPLSLLLGISRCCCFSDSLEPSGLSLVQWGAVFCLRSYFHCISLIKGRTHFFYVKG